MLETAIGVFGGLVLFAILNSLLEVPQNIRRARAERKFKAELERVANEMFNMAQQAKKEIQNAERAKANQSRKGTAKTAGSRASKTGTRSQSGRRNSNTNGKVQSGRKGTSKKA